MALVLCILMSCAVKAQGRLTFVEYNCENLFDCRHDTLKDDYEFLPDAKRRWNFGRYWKKLNDISRVIVGCGAASVGEGEDPLMPDFVAMVEVENDSVMTMLTRASALKGAGYRYVMTNSEDVRGVDVALLYNPLTFRMEHSYSLRVAPPQKHQRKTRDILYAKGYHRSGDTLHIFVVHAPSRGGGYKFTEPYRVAVTRRLMQSIDSLHSKDADARIIVAGDFNDYSTDKSLQVLRDGGLTDISDGARGAEALGTYKFQGEWGSLDHIFVSAPLQKLVHNCFIYDAPWLLEEDTQKGMRPCRTFRGPTYHGGVSDHLPLVVRMEK